MYILYTSGYDFSIQNTYLARFREIHKYIHSHHIILGCMYTAYNIDII